MEKVTGKITGNKIRKQTTKEDLLAIIKLWPKYSVKEIAERIGRKEFFVGTNVRRMREAGIDLPKKFRKNATRELIDQIINEL